MGIKAMKLPISFGVATKSTVDDDFFKTLNSIYFDPESSNTEVAEEEEEEEEVDNDENDEMESIIRGAHMESRLFFDPSTDKSMIRSVEEAGPHLDCVALALESADPYEDFKKSMEEMSAVIAKNRDWGCLEELLAWYLSVNQRNNHAYIIAAFVDLLLNLSNDGDNNKDSHVNEGFSSSNGSSRRSSSCVSGELLQQLPKSSSSASFFSSSSPSNSSLSQEQEKL